MAEPELGGIWRQLPHEPTPAEDKREWDLLDREAERARDQYISDLRNPSLHDIAERREELRQSGMDGDQIDGQMSRERQQDIARAERLEQERKMAEPDVAWPSLAREHNRALERSSDLISTPIDPRRQQELDHLAALKQPQRFPLTEVKMTDPTVITQLVDTYWKARLDTPLTDQQKQQQQTLQLASQRQQQRHNEEVDQRQTNLSL